MKILFNRIYILLVISVILSSCTGNSLLIKHSIFLTGYDFRPYTEKGFLFTPEKYEGDYEAIALVNVQLWPHVTLYSILSDEQKESGKYKKHGSYAVEETDITELLRKAYNESSAMGANAIINLEITHKEWNNLSYPDESLRYLVNLNSYILTGFAIKRK